MTPRKSRSIEIRKKNLASWIINRFSKWLLKEPKLPPSLLSDFARLRVEIKPADVLLIEGNNRVSRIIRQITQSSWSHSVLYIGRLDQVPNEKERELIRRLYKAPHDEQLVIESIMGEGTVIKRLSDYKDFHIRICRPQGILPDDAKKVIDYAIEHLGMKYDLRHIFDLARFLFPYAILPRRWRSTLFQHNALKPTKEICSFMIASAFQSVNFPILPYVYRDEKGYILINRNPLMYTPKDFDYSPYFDIIKYPILPVGETGYYREFPWRHGYLSDDGRMIYKTDDGKLISPSSLDKTDPSQIEGTD